MTTTQSTTIPQPTPMEQPNITLPQTITQLIQKANSLDITLTPECIREIISFIEEHNPQNKSTIVFAVKDLYENECNHYNSYVKKEIIDKFSRIKLLLGETDLGFSLLVNFKKSIDLQFKDFLQNRGVINWVFETSLEHLDFSQMIQCILLKETDSWIELSNCEKNEKVILNNPTFSTKELCIDSIPSVYIVPKENKIVIASSLITSNSSYLFYTDI